MRSWMLGIVVAILPAVAGAQLCTDLIGNGSIGLYADAAGTSQCISAPPGMATIAFVIAKLEGGSANGITGAEYRIEFAQENGSAPTGWLSPFPFSPAPGNSVALGNPFDLLPQDPTNEAGANIAWATCVPDPIGGQLLLGTVTLFNFGAGTPFIARTKQKTPASSPAGGACPLFAGCDSPVFSRIRLTPLTWELGREGIASVSHVNVPGCPTCPPIAPLGVYADSMGTSSPLCAEAQIPTTFHLVGLVPFTQPAGVTGAEFRIEVENPTGYFFDYLPPSSASVFGSPFDLTPGDPNDATGATVLFPQCRPTPTPAAGDLIDFGRILVVNFAGGTSQIRVRRKNPPGDPGQLCPRYFMCDAPFNTPICMDESADIVFETTLNPMSCLPVPFTTETLALDTHENGSDGAAGPVSTSQVMNHRKQFLITVQGNLSMWPPSSWIAPPNVLCGVPERTVMTPSPNVTNYWAGADAMVTFAVPLPAGGDCSNLEGLGYPRNHGRFQIDLGSGFKTLTPLGGIPSDPSPGHLYRFLVTGEDAGGSFRWIDTSTSDNYGVLTITIEEANPSDVTIMTPPRRLRMLGNVPDPFNPTTRVRYELQASADVAIEVFDVRSRLVRALFHGAQPPGVREVLWDGRANDGVALPSGVYFVRVTSPHGTGVERVTLVR